MSERDVLLTQTEDGHHKFVDAPEAPEPVFAIGAQVVLKSGGPVMTVDDYIANDDLISVAWFVGGTIVRDAFHWSMLKLAEPQEQK